MIYQYIKALIQSRSPRWPGIRKKWLLKNPTCAACGTNSRLEVHHIKPYHLYPDLELDERNFITLCEGPLKDHLIIGHRGNWQNINPNVIFDAQKLLKERKNGSYKELQ